MKAINSKEFTEWMAYYALEPFGQEADNWRMAQLLALTANVYRPKGRRAYEPEDFMPRWERRSGEVDQNQLKAKLDAVMIGWGGKMDGGNAGLPPKSTAVKPQAATEAVPARVKTPPSRRTRRLS